MTFILFVSVVAVMCGGLIMWGNKFLPRENWQVLASVPYKKNDDGSWQSYTFTYYGVFMATSYIVALITFFVMSGAAAIPMWCSAVIVLPVLFICVPASRLVARIVEKKNNTFTVGGAVFVGIIIGPFVVLGVNEVLIRMTDVRIDVGYLIALLGIGYAFGEGLGRLACLSFGCCYGKKMDDMPRWVQIIFSKMHISFSGECKKVSYEGKLEGVKLFPVQVVTSVLYTVLGLVALVCVYYGLIYTSLLLSLCCTQLWRFISEFVRNDYRGETKISAYQKMGLIAVVYIAGVYPLLFSHGGRIAVDMALGIQSFWSAPTIIFLQILWLVIFIYTGKSTVLCSHSRFSVIKENI